MLIVSVSNVPSFSSTVAALKTMLSEDSSSGYVSTNLIEEAKYHKETSANEGQHAVLGSRKNRKDLTCFRCGKRGHFARSCRLNSNFNMEVSRKPTEKKFKWPQTGERSDRLTVLQCF